MVDALHPVVQHKVESAAVVLVDACLAVEGVLVIDELGLCLVEETRCGEA